MQTGSDWGRAGEEGGERRARGDERKQRGRSIIDRGGLLMGLQASTGQGHDAVFLQTETATLCFNT